MLGWVAYMCILAGMLVAVVQPYKSKIYNTVDVVLTLSVGLCFSGVMSLYIEAPFEKPICLVMFMTPVCVPMLYFIGYIGFLFYLNIRRLFNRSINVTHRAAEVEHSLLFNIPQT